VTATTVSELIIIDSSGWLEFITVDTKVDLFAPYFADANLILMPSIVIYEVRKVLLSRHSKTLADEFVSQALRLHVIPIDEDIALKAAAFSIQSHLTMADGLIYECAQANQAKLITSDAHFANLPNVTML
jgi:predicted nucleic acid-binding protein